MAEKEKVFILVMWVNDHPVKYCILQSDCIFDGELRKCPENAVNTKTLLYLEYQLIEGLIVYAGSFRDCKVKYEQYTNINVGALTSCSPEVGSAPTVPTIQNVATIVAVNGREEGTGVGNSNDSQDATSLVKIELNQEPITEAEWKEREASLLSEIERLKGKEKCSKMKEAKKKWKKLYKDSTSNGPVEIFPGSLVKMQSTDLQKMLLANPDKPNVLGRALLKHLFHTDELMGRSLYGAKCNANRSAMNPFPEIDPVRRDAIIGCVMKKQGFDINNPPTRGDPSYHKYAGIKRALRSSLQAHINFVQKQLDEKKKASTTITSNQ